MLDPSNKRLLALLSAPMFALLSKYAKIDLAPEVQELLVVSVITYILGSHGKEAIVARANAAGVAAAATVAPGPTADAVVDAAAKGAP
jgi:hypothetical protein